MADDEQLDVEAVVDELPAEIQDAAREAVEDAIDSTAMVVADPRDEQEVMVAMDAHDAARFLDGLVSQAQERNLGKKWVYEFTSEGRITRGLTGDAVEDITQAMNWTRRARIHALPETLDVERVLDDEGEILVVATIAATDDVGGSTFIGTSSEPQKLTKRDKTKSFDKFARAKAINKAERNALEKHIPTIVKVTLLAMAAGDPGLVEHIQTEAAARVADLPPALDTPEAKALIAELEGLYDEIRGLGGGRGATLFTPGEFGAYVIHAQHDLGRLEQLRSYVLERRDKIKETVG